MSRRKLAAGSTSITVPIFIQDTTSTTGAGLGSLVFNTSGLAAKYRREGDSTWTTITLVTATVGTWTSSGFISDGGPVTGGYEISVPNAVLAAGAKWAQIELYGATNMLPVLLEFELDQPTNFSVFSIDSNGRSKIQSGITKNLVINNFEFTMYDSADHVTPKTGLTVTATRSIDGASFASCANAISEIGTTGNYKINLATTDLNGNVIKFKFSATGADDTIVDIITTP